MALVGAQFAAALAHVHARGIRHRDVKPGNVIVHGDHVTLVDFGIATEGAHRTMNLRGSTLGTVAYAPPEWGGATPTDPVLWDAYGLGVLLWECLTGRVAFPMPPEMALREAVVHVMSRKTDPDALQLDAAVPAPLRAAVAALTQHDPADRQGDLEAVAAALASLADAGRGVLPTARPLDPPAVEPIEDAPRDAGPEGSPGQDTHTLHAVLDVVDDLAPLGGSGIGVAPAPAEADRPADDGAPAAEPPTLQLGAGRDRDPPVARLAVVGALFAAAVGVTWWSTWSPPRPRPRPAWCRSTSWARPRRGRRGVGGRQARQPETRGPHHGGGAPLRGRCGRGCGDPPVDPPPATCGLSSRTLTIPAGDGPYLVRLDHPVASPADLQVALTGPSARRARLDAGDWIPVSGSTFTAAAVAPGPHRLVVQGGSCPADEPCGAECPPTCSEASADFEAPFVASAPLSLDLVPPGLVGRRLLRRGPAGDPEGVRPLAAAQPGHHPRKLRGSALADDKYLDNWTVRSVSAAPAHEVPYAVAAEFCRRGSPRWTRRPPPGTGRRGGGGVRRAAGRPRGRPVVLGSDGPVAPVEATKSMGWASAAGEPAPAGRRSCAGLAPGWARRGPEIFAGGMRRRQR